MTIKEGWVKQGEEERKVVEGIRKEAKGVGGVGKADEWMENCETSAIGRALFNAGFQKSNGEKKASREEMQKVVNKQEQSKKEVAKITNDSAEKFAVDIGAKKKGGKYQECGRKSATGSKRKYPKCVPLAKATAMTKSQKASAVSRKRAAGNAGPKPTNVRT